MNSDNASQLIGCRSGNHYGLFFLLLFRMGFAVRYSHTGRMLKLLRIYQQCPDYLSKKKHDWWLGNDVHSHNGMSKELLFMCLLLALLWGEVTSPDCSRPPAWHHMRSLLQSARMKKTCAKTVLPETIHSKMVLAQLQFSKCIISRVTLEMADKQIVIFLNKCKPFNPTLVQRSTTHLVLS